MAYLLDANVFIQAKNLHYGLDFCPAFWDWLIANNAASIVFSIEKVGDELVAGNDELADWARARGTGFFLKPDSTTLNSMTAVGLWATAQQYQPAAVTTFLQLADYYLVAHAHAGGYTVVTHEVPSASIRRIKIPDDCISLGIRCITPFEMLRLERARFILAPSSQTCRTPDCSGLILFSLDTVSSDSATPVATRAHTASRRPQATCIAGDLAPRLIVVIPRRDCRV